MNLIVKKLIQLNNCFLNKDEKNFILSLKNKIKFIDKKKGGLLIMNASHFYFLHQLFLINSKIFQDYKFDGIWVNPVVRRSKNIFGFISYKVRFFFMFLLYLKWSKLYKAIGIERTFNISQIDINNYQRKQSYKNANFFLKKKIKKKI